MTDRFFLQREVAAPRAREGQEGKIRRPREGSEFVEEDLQPVPTRQRSEQQGLADDATATAPCVTGFCVSQEFSFSI